MEKISIYVPEKIAKNLDSDAKFFEVYKRNREEINKNKFLNLLIKNYFEEYQEENEVQYQAIRSSIDPNKIRRKQRDNIAKSVFDQLYLPTITSEKGHRLTKISLKPTSSSELVIKQIEKEIGIQYHLSQYYCWMLMRYCEKPICEREKIIFQENYRTIERCCKEGKIIAFNTIWNDKTFHKVIPYKIVTGSEEMHNYLLCAEINPQDESQKEMSVCLNRIASVETKRSKGTIDEAVKKHLDLTEQMGPAYCIHEEKECCIFLTNEGRMSFKRMYFGRPTLDEKKPNVDGYYYFRCSEDQLFLYFRRFGSDARVIYPESLKKRFADYYADAYNTYREQE